MKRILAVLVLVLSAGLLLALWFRGEPQGASVPELLASADSLQAAGEVRDAHEVYRRALGSASGNDKVQVLEAMMANMGAVEMRSVAQGAARLAYVVQTADAIVEADPNNVEALKFRLTYAKTVADAAKTRAADEQLLARSEEMLELYPENTEARQYAALARWRLEGGGVLAQRVKLSTVPKSAEVAAALATVDLQEAEVIGPTAKAVQELVLRQANARFADLPLSWRELLVRWQVARMRQDEAAAKAAVAAIAEHLPAETDEAGWLALWDVLVTAGAAEEAASEGAPSAQAKALARGRLALADGDVATAKAAFEFAAEAGPKLAVFAAVGAHQRQLLALQELRRLYLAEIEAGAEGQSVVAALTKLDERLRKEGVTLKVKEEVRSAFVRRHYNEVLHLLAGTGEELEPEARWYGVQAAMALGSDGHALGLVRPLTATRHELADWYPEAIRACATLLMRARYLSAATRFVEEHADSVELADVAAALAFARFASGGEVKIETLREQLAPLLGRLPPARAAALRIQTLVAADDLPAASEAVAIALRDHGMTADLAAALLAVHTRLRDSKALAATLEAAAMPEAHRPRLLAMAQAPVDYAGLLQVCRAVGAREPERQWAGVLRAEMGRLGGRPEQVAGEIPEKLRSRPVVVEALFDLAIRKRDAEQAEGLLTEAVWLEPSARELWRLRIQGVRGHRDAQRQDLEAAVRKWPLNRALRIALGRALLVAGDSDAAEPHLEFALALNYGDAEASYLLAQPLIERRATARVAGLLRTALAKEPGNRALARTFLRLAESTKEPGEQLRLRLQYAAVAPADGDNLVKVVALLEELGHPEVGALIVQQMRERTHGLSLGQIRIIADGMRSRGMFAAGEQLLVDYAKAAAVPRLASEAWLWVARYRHGTPAAAQAEEAFRAALTADTEHVEARLAYGRWLAAHDKIDEALTVTEAVPAARRGTIRAEILLAAKRAPEALAELAGLPEKDALAKQILATRAHLQLGEYGHARAAAEAALAADADSIAAHRSMVEAVFAHPEPELLEGLEGTLERWAVLADSEADKVPVFRALAHYYELTGRLKKAAGTMSMVARRDGTEASAWKTAELHIRRGEAMEAAILVRPRMQAGSPSLSWLRIYAKIVELDGKDASAAWETVWKRSKAAADLMQLLVQRWQHLPRAEFDAFVAALPQEAREEPVIAAWLLDRRAGELAWPELAGEALALWRSEGASVAVRCRALELMLWLNQEPKLLVTELEKWPDDGGGLLLAAQAVALARAERGREALAIFDRVVTEFQPWPDEALGLLAYCSLELRRGESGAAILERRLAEAPMSVALRNNLANLLAASGRGEEGAKIAAAAQQLVKEEPDRLANLMDTEAACLLAMGAPNRAKQVVERGLELRSTASLQLRLAEALTATDDAEDLKRIPVARAKARELAMAERNWLVLNRLKSSKGQ